MADTYNAYNEAPVKRKSKLNQKPVLNSKNNI